MIKMSLKGVQLVKPKKPEVENKYYFYEFVRPILLVFRCLGILPISGLISKSSNSTRGSLKSWYTTIYFVIIALQSLRCTFITYEIFLMTSRIESIEKFGNILVTIFHYTDLLYMMRFSLKWEKLINQIESLEKLLPFKNHQRFMNFIPFLVAMIITSAVVDFCVFASFFWMLLGQCVSSSNMNFETLYNTLFSWIIDFLPYHSLSVLLLLFLRLQMHLLWSCIDTLIMVVSLYLWCKFQHFNEIILQKQQSDQSRGVASWSTLQVHYTQISRIVALVDESISPMVLTSYFCNLLFIFKQIFHIIKRVQNTDLLAKSIHCTLVSYSPGTITYYIFPCIVVIIRTGLISYFASKLHSASREPLNALHTFPSSAFNIDMQRLMTQVYYSKISLTGYNFFAVTRNLTLAIIGTLITYELVLFQL